MKLKELRKQKSYTQEDIAKILNVAVSTYRGYENKTSEPTIDTLKKITKKPRKFGLFKRLDTNLIQKF